MKRFVLLMVFGILLSMTALVGCDGGADSSEPFSSAPPLSDGERGDAASAGGTSEKPSAATSAPRSSATTTAAPRATSTSGRTAATTTAKAATTVDRSTLKESAMRFFNNIDPAALFAVTDSASLSSLNHISGLSLAAQGSTQSATISWARKGDYECLGTFNNFDGEGVSLETITYYDDTVMDIFTTADGRRTWDAETVVYGSATAEESVLMPDIASMTFPKLTEAQLSVYGGELYLDNSYLVAFVEKNLGPLTGKDTAKLSAAQRNDLLATAKKTLERLHLSVTLSTTRNSVSHIIIQALPTDEDAKHTGIASVFCRIDLTADTKHVQRIDLTMKSTPADDRVSYSPTSTLTYIATIDDGKVTGATVKISYVTAQTQDTDDGKQAIVFEKTHLALSYDGAKTVAGEDTLAFLSAYSHVDKVYKENSSGIMAVVDSRLHDRYGKEVGFDLSLMETDDADKLELFGQCYGLTEYGLTLYGDVYLGEPENFPDPIPPYVFSYIANRQMGNSTV